LNILYIWDADYPWDIRVEKICNALKKNGHEVHIASRNLKKRPVYEDIDGIRIHRIRIWDNDKLNYMLSFPLFFSPIWKKFLDTIIRENKINLIIVRDLPMAIAGIWAGKRSHIPVIFDMAEDYVSMIRDIWKMRKYKGLNLIVRNPYLAKLVERYTFKHANSILVVIDEAAQVVTSGGGDISKITIVSNTPKLSDFDEIANLESEQIEYIQTHYSVIYTGGIQMGRGLQTVLEAIPEIVKQIPDFLFVVVGDGYASAQLKKMIIEKNIDKYVLWVGWINHEQIFTYIKNCKVGIIPHKVTEHVKTTIPNKIFDYLGCGLPVIASDALPMKKILENEHCGITFKSGDADDLKEAVFKIHNSKYDYASNGKRAIMNKYNWHEDEKRLMHVINGYA